MVDEGTFRQDLYYRLNIVPLEIPPLSRRLNDIPILFKHFINEQIKNDGRENLSIDPKVIKALESYEWPGNVRELENLAKRLVALTTGECIEVNDLPENIQKQKKGGNIPTELPDTGFDLEEWVDSVVTMALKKNGWNQSVTAKYLNVSRNTLIYRMEKRGLRQK